MALTKTRDDEKPRLALAELARTYDAERARVDAAHQRMRAITAVPHQPARAREAARELTTALRTATATASRTLEAATLAIPPAPRHHLGRRKADRSVPLAVRHWSTELVRLAEIGVWLRRVTLDDLGVALPMTVRVANYAAKGPHIAGLDFGNQAADSPGGPRIGIDFAAAIDAVHATRPTGSPEPVSTGPTTSAKVA